MKMIKKDIITIIIIIVFIVGINTITDKIMNDAVYEIRSITGIIEEKLNQKIIDIESIKKLDKKWEEKEKLLSYFSEHDELEKVTKEMKDLLVSSDNKLEDEIKEELEQIKFLLSHIEEKNKLKLKNIF